MPKTSLRLTRDFRAWSGTRQDLLALGQVMESQFEDERNRIRNELETSNKRLDKELASIEQELQEASDGQDREAIKYRLETVESDRRRASEKAQRELNFIRVKLAMTDKESEKTEDTIDALIDDYDFASAEDMQLSCITPWADRSCFITFSRDPFGDVALSVSGDTPWVRAAFGALEKQMRKSQPWWHFARHMAAQVILVLAIGIGATAALIGLTSLFTPLSEAIDGLIFTYGLLIVAAVIAMPLSTWVITTFFPGFEIRDPDVTTTRKKVSRTISIAVGGFLAFVAALQGIAWILERVRPGR